MKVLISGTSRGIGKAVAERYLSLGHEVFGLDKLEASINHPSYHHYMCDVSKRTQLPDIKDINIIFNNAGTQNSGHDIENNLIGSVNVTEKYAFDNPSLKSILFNASASASSGQEFPLYAASKAGVLGYMKNTAIRLAPQQVTVNSISLGGVITESNLPVMEDEKSWQKIMDVTPMKKWMTLDEVCDWVIFLTIKNKSLSGQDIVIDNGEKDLNSTFVWLD